MATRARDLGGIADCTRAHSIKSFLFNAPMSCSIERSRAASCVMVGVDIGKRATLPRHPVVNCCRTKCAIREHEKGDEL